MLDAALPNETELLRLLIQEVPAAIAMFDRDMRYVAASRRWIDAFLPGVASPIGRCHYDLFPECPERWRVDHRRGLAGEDVRVDEDSWTLPDGSQLWMRYDVRPWRRADGDIGGILIVTEDITERRRTEAELKKTYGRLNAALSTPQITLFHQDLDLRYTWIHSPALGFDVSEIVGRRDLDFLEREDEVERLDAIKSGVIRAGMEARAEVRIHHHGVPHWYDLIVEPAMEDGRVSGIDCVAIDITERRLAQRALAASEERLSVAKAAAGLGIHDYDVINGEVTWDDRVRELWGVTKDEPISYSTFLSGLHPDDVASTEAAVARAFDPTGDGLYCAEYRVISRKDGKARWVVATGKTTFIDGKAARLVGSVQDITERKEMELERERSRVLLDAVLMSMPAGVMIADPSGRIVRSNTANGSMWGLDTGDGRVSPTLEALALRGRRYPGGQPLQLEDWPLVRALKKRETVPGELIEIEPFDGGPARVIVKMAAPALASDGTLIGAVAVQTDITERVRFEEALKRADRQKDVFLATLSHELRNPLAPIRTAADLLANPKLDPSQIAWVQAVIQRQVKHLSILLDDLLDLARITQGKLELRRQVVTAQSVIDSALEATRPLMDRKNHSLKVDLPSEPVFLDVDPIRAAQIVTNLLTNAAKYTDPGGTIRIQVREQEERAAIHVTDSGAGIAKEVLPFLFEMFSQGDASRGQPEGGLGVGLALVKGLAELHGGSVTAHSDGLGRGSEFTLILPLAAHRPAPGGPAIEVPSSMAGCRVLVVDDNRDGADALAMTLQLSGQTARVAYDGASALATAQAFRPDIAVLDIGMPAMDGYELARRLRGEPWSTDLVLIALTGWGQRHDRDRASQEGFDHHLTKPADPAEVMRLIALHRPPSRVIERNALGFELEARDALGNGE